jgi:hypothetical protein
LAGHNDGLTCLWLARDVLLGCGAEATIARVSVAQAKAGCYWRNPFAPLRGLFDRDRQGVADPDITPPLLTIPIRNTTAANRAKGELRFMQSIRAATWWNFYGGPQKRRRPTNTFIFVEQAFF